MKKEMKRLKGFNLQFFADGGEGGDDPEGTPTGTNTDNGEANLEPGTTSTDDDKPFTQEDMDALASKIRKEERDKQERKSAKEPEELERKELEEKEDYRKLLDKANEKLVEYETKEKAMARQETIEGMLTEKGLTPEQIKRYSKYVQGESEEDISKSVEGIYEDFAAIQGSQQKDPAAGFGDKKDQVEVNDEDYGRKLFESIKKSKGVL